MVARSDNASIRVKIGGMTCASCVSSVTTALESVPGVIRADVSLVMESANVSFRAGTMAVDRLPEAVNAAGYDATIQESAVAPDSRSDTSESARVNNLLIRAIASIAAAAAIMGAMWSMTILGASHDYEIAFNVVAFGITAPIMVWVGSAFYRSAWAALRRKTSNMDTLISVGITAAFVYSTGVTLAQVASGNPEIWGDATNSVTTTYFEVAAAIVGLVTLGRWLEANTRRKSSEAVKRLVELQPQTAVLVINEELVETPIDEITAGHVVVVRPGERVAVDGNVQHGRCDIDESMLTGESVPVNKKPGDRVFAGTVCASGSVRVSAVDVGENTLLAEITRNVAMALSSRAQIERLVDRITRYFVPAILVVASATFALWLLLGTQPSLPSAIIAATTVLVIACPCALGLATPTAVVAGIGRASEFGALIKNAEAAERLASIDTAILDKTGTITYGQMQVSAIHVAESSGLTQQQVISLAASVESSSEHPIGRAITELAMDEQVSFSTCDAFNNEPGAGVSGIVDGKRVDIYKPESTKSSSRSTPDSIETAVNEMRRGHQSAVVVSVDGEAVAAIAVADRVRDEAPNSVKALKALGIETHMLTGDNPEVAKAVARTTGVDVVWAGVSPTGKSYRVRKLRESGRSVAMVGDGINDGPALAEADVGIAMGAGTDVAIEAANDALLTNDLETLPKVVRIGRATLRVVRQNLAWAFAYNMLLVPIAAGALIPFFAESPAPSILRPLISANGALNPIAAAAAMALSSVSVSLNSLRLRRFRP